MDITITIDDPAQVAGITWARQQNSEFEGKTDAEYIAWIVTQATASYAAGKRAAAEIEALRAAKEDGDFTKFDALRADMGGILP